MAIERPAFKSFSSGEISPRMGARSDMAMYHTALAKCENFTLTPQGSILMRRGWKFVDELADSYTRLFTFPRALGNDIIISISNGIIRAFDDDQYYAVAVGSDPNIQIPTEVELVTNGDFGTGDLTGWGLATDLHQPAGFTDYNDVVSGEFLSANISVVGGNFNLVTITQQLANPNTRLFSPFIYLSFDVDYDPANYAPHEGLFPAYEWEFIYRADADLTVPIDIPHAIQERGNSVGTQVIVPFDPIAGLGGYIMLRGYSPIEAVNFYNVAQFDNISAKMYVYANPPAGPSVIPWNDAEIKELHFQIGLDTDSVLITQRDNLPFQLKFDKDTNSFRISPFYPVGTPPWTDETGYPATSEVFQGRLWLASTKDEPSGLWGSKSGEHGNFIIGGGLPADAMYLPLATNGTIQSMIGSSNTLYLMTDLGEHTVTSQGPFIQSGDAAATSVSSYGSSNVNARVLGSQIAFVSPDTKKLLVASFDDSLKNWTASDTSIVAQHLLSTRLGEFHDLRNPEYQVVCLTEDGNWKQMLYDNSMGLLGWQKNTIDGNILSMTVTKSRDGDVLWAVVDRGGRTDVVKMNPIGVEDVLLDFWGTRPIAEDGDGFYIIGLDHLANQVVGILIDGTTHRQVTVSNIGHARLTRGGTSAHVGLPYKAIAVTLPVEPADGSQSYSGGKRRNADITVRLHNSALPLINGKRPPERTPQTNMGAGQPLTTGDVSTSSLGWDDTGSVTIEQDLPVNTEIVGIFTKLAIKQK